MRGIYKDMCKVKYRKSDIKVIPVHNLWILFAHVSVHVREYCSRSRFEADFSKLFTLHIGMQTYMIFRSY